MESRGATKKTGLYILFLWKLQSSGTDKVCMELAENKHSGTPERQYYRLSEVGTLPTVGIAKVQWEKWHRTGP